MAMTRTVLVTGAASQLAQCLELSDAPSGWQAVYLPRDELDIGDGAQVKAVLDEIAPDCIINTAAWTAVERAEREPARARRSNAAGAANLARWCGGRQARLIHVSTDFVFDGKSPKPYAPGDATAPLGAYGASKLAGEREVAKLPPGQGVILRTSWLYSEFGHNFVKTMLGLLAERDEVAVVSDQTGCPTSAHSLAGLMWRMLSRQAGAGLYHWNDGGETSWYGFAREIQRQGLAAGLLRKEIRVRPLATADYPTAARRPAYSAMDRGRALREFDLPEGDWREALNGVIRAIARQEAAR